MKWEKQSDARINNTRVQMCAAVTVPFLTGKSAKVISTRIMIMPQEQVEGIRENFVVSFHQSQNALAGGPFAGWC